MLISSGLETVTDAGLRQQVLRLRGIPLELVAQVPDVDAQVMAAFDEGGAPDIAQQAALRQDLAWMPQKCG